MPKFRTLIQNSKMFALAAQAGLSHDDLRDYAAEIRSGRTARTSKLTVAEADEIIHRLESALNIPQQAPRTVTRQRKAAGIVQIATAAHIDLMQAMARQRGITKNGLGDLSARINKDGAGNGIREPRTSIEVNRVIEAIKAMNRRGAIKKEAA